MDPDPSPPLHLNVNDEKTTKGHRGGNGTGHIYIYIYILDSHMAPSGARIAAHISVCMACGRTHGNSFALSSVHETNTNSRIYQFQTNSYV